MRRTAAVRTNHRPAGNECHHNDRRPHFKARTGEGSPAGSPRASTKDRQVLVAPIMHKDAFVFVDQLGAPIQRVAGCDRQGAIIPESRFKALACAGGGLEPVDRPPDQPYNGQEAILPLVAIYRLNPDGSSGEGQSYQIVNYSNA